MQQCLTKYGQLTKNGCLALSEVPPARIPILRNLLFMALWKRHPGVLRENVCWEEL